MENILTLRKMGITVTCQTPINALTFPEYKAISEWCYERGIRYTANAELYNAYSGKSNQVFAIRKEEFDNTRKNIRRTGYIQAPFAKPTPIFGKKHYFDCVSGKYYFVLSYDNKLRPCFMNWDDPKEIFDASVSLEEALSKMISYVCCEKEKTLSFCKGCIASPICNECQVMQRQHSRDLKSYMDESCKQKMSDFLSMINDM